MGSALALAAGAISCRMRSQYAISQWGRGHGAAMAEGLGFAREQTPGVAAVHGCFQTWAGRRL